MNSHCKENLIIFEMALVPTRFEGHIKIKVSSALESQRRVKLGQNQRESVQHLHTPFHVSIKICMFLPL